MVIFAALLPFRSMAEPPGRTIAIIKDSPRLPEALWLQFKETARRREGSWVDALRKLITRYVNEPDPTQLEGDATPSGRKVE